MTSTLSVSLEPTSTLPESGLTSALKLRRRVVFPDPLSPTSATHSPAATATLTPSRAVVLPKRLMSDSAESVGAAADVVDEPGGRD